MCTNFTPLKAEQKNEMRHRVYEFSSCVLKVWHVIWSTLAETFKIVPIFIFSAGLRPTENPLKRLIWPLLTKKYKQKAVGDVLWSLVKCVLIHPRQREGQEAWREDVKNVSSTAGHQGTTQNVYIGRRPETKVLVDITRFSLKTDWIRRATPYVIVWAGRSDQRDDRPHRES